MVICRWQLEMTAHIPWIRLALIPRVPAMIASWFERKNKLDFAFTWDRPEFELTSDDACRQLSAELSRFARKAGSSSVRYGMQSVAAMLDGGLPDTGDAHAAAELLSRANLGMEMGDLPSLIDKAVQLLRRI